MPATNPTLDLLLAHRSIRHYREGPVPDADIRAAVIAGQAASTSSAVQAVSLIQVQDDVTRDTLVTLTGGQTKVAKSGAFFVICGDVRRHRLTCEDAGAAYNARLEAFLVAAVDASLFAQNLVVAFESMGYGACYIGGLRNNLPAVDAALGDLPEGVYPLYGLCVGVPGETPIARPRLPVEAVWMRETYLDDDTLRSHMRAYDADYAAYMEARGAPKRGWTGGIAKMFSKIQRAGLAAYYAAQGADLG